MKAHLNNYRQSPQKVRLVAKSILGKPVEDAITILSFMPKRSALPLQKLISSAVANAGQEGFSKETLKVASLEVNKGVTLKRIRARARGSAFRINKRTSNVSVTLGERTLKKAPVVATVKEAPVKKASVKKVATKKVTKKADN